MTEQAQENQKEETTSVALSAQDSAIIFSERGLEVILPKNETEDERVNFYATLTAAISLRLTDETWVQDLISWMQEKVTGTSDEDLLKQFAPKNEG